MLYIIMYHYVRDLANSRYPNIKGLDAALFKRQLEFLKSKFTIIGTEDLLNAAFSTVHKDYALLTFDDGYIDHYTTVFPLLAAYDISGFFAIPGKIIREEKVLDVNKIHFLLASTSPIKLKNRIFSLLDHYRGKEFNIPSNDLLYQELAMASRFDTADIVFIKKLLQYKLDEKLRNVIIGDLFIELISIPEKEFAKELYMTMEQIKLMKKCGQYFGIHGYNHYHLGSLNMTDMQNDINAALDVFCDVLDTSNWVMNYPYGSYNEETLKYITANGCQLGFTTRVAVAEIPTNKNLELPRLDTNDFPPKSDNWKNCKKYG